MRSNSRRFPFVLALFVIMRFALWGWMLLIRSLYPVTLLSPERSANLYLGVTPTKTIWLDVWQRWDALNYQAIAQRGYAAFSTSLFTPPLFPGLMRWTGWLLHGNDLLGGLIVSSLFCLAALWVFYLLAEYELKDDAAARRALVYLLFFPTSFFLFAPYTESLFFLGAVLCLHALQKKHWVLAGLAGAFAASSRLTGVLVILPALWETLHAKEKRAWTTPILIALGGIAFPLYVWLGMGRSPLAPFEAQSARFHGGFTLPGLNLALAVRQIWQGINVTANSMDLVFTVSFIPALYLVWIRLPKIYSVYCFGYGLLYLSRYADIYPLLSMTRYVLAFFPVFMALPWVDHNIWIRRLIIYGFALGLLFFSAQYAIWGWVG